MVRNIKGFTLVELMIVIAIIGVLAVALIPTLTGAQAKARDTGRISALTNIATSMISYKNDAGTYPGVLYGRLTDANGDLANFSAVAGGAADAVLTANLKQSFQGWKAPMDPQKLAIVWTPAAAVARTSATCQLAGPYGYNAGIIKAGDINYTAGVFVSRIENVKQGNADALPTAAAAGQLMAAAVGAWAKNYYVKVTE